MTKNNSNWKEIEKEYINNIVGCRINDLKSRDLRQVAEDTLKFFKPYFQEKMHEISLRELEEEHPLYKKEYNELPEIVDNNPKE